jgi:hypothetical protein
MTQTTSKPSRTVGSSHELAADPRDIAVRQAPVAILAGTTRRASVRRVTMWTLLGLLGAGVWAAPLQSAIACGGVMVQTESTVVTDHRMAFSISKQQTVLWDQIRYQGSPQEFVWVLPVREGARIELSSDRWMASLDALTQPRIVQPLRDTGDTDGSGCGGCTGYSSASEDRASGGANAVQVVSEKAVGPYQTVILRSKNPRALEEWLAQNGYKIPESVKPFVRQYVAEGFDFLAMRLRPAASVRQMEPVRIVSPGADVGLPLRMVAAGIGANVGLTLYVIGEGRYQTANFPNALLDASKLFWDFPNRRSNYQQLSTETMAQEQGRTWLTEASLPNSGVALRDLYRNGNLGPNVPGLPFDDGGANVDGGSAPSNDAGESDASDPFDGSATDQDAAIDGGSNPRRDGGGGGTDALDDFALAVEGVRSDMIWVTRLRANLPVASLSQDLKLEAAPKQEGISSQYLARDPDPAQGQSSISPASPRNFGTGVVVVLTMGWLAIRLRRREPTVSRIPSR